MGGDNNLTFVLRSLEGRCYGNQLISGRFSESCHTLPSFFYMTFHKGLEYRNTSGRFNTGDDPFISDRNLGNFNPVTRGITRLNKPSLPTAFVDSSGVFQHHSPKDANC